MLANTFAATCAMRADVEPSSSTLQPILVSSRPQAHEQFNLGAQTRCFWMRQHLLGVKLHRCTKQSIENGAHIHRQNCCTSQGLFAFSCRQSNQVTRVQMHLEKTMKFGGPSDVLAKLMPESRRLWEFRTQAGHKAHQTRIKNGLAGTSQQADRLYWQPTITPIPFGVSNTSLKK